MHLPDLPKKRKHDEADITPDVAEWFLQNYPDDVAIEVKVKGNKTKPHQDLALDQVKQGKFKYKLPDMGRRNPFDIVVLKKAKAFVVTCDGLSCTAVGKHGETFNFTL